MEEKEILIDNLKINYKTAGEGPAVLVLHGWGGSSDSWVKVMENLANNGFKAVCPDLPGFGKSKPSSFPWDLENYSEWVNKFTGYLSLEKFFLIAHSFGGRIAVKFAIKHPEKINKLILCASAAIKPAPGLKTRIIYRLARAGNAVFSLKHLERLKDGARNFFYIFLRNRDYVKAKGIMKETIKKVLEEDLLPDLEKIKIKTLLLWGGNDRLVPVKYAYIFKEKIKNSELEILPKIGHGPHLETPYKLAEVIVNFLKS